MLLQLCSYIVYYAIIYIIIVNNIIIFNVPILYIKL